MKKIEDLEIDLGVDGWRLSGGRSNNVWGQVPTKNLPFDQINSAIRQGKRSPVFTCYDSVIYATDSTGKMREISEKDLPKTISATFKPTFTRTGALCENLGMRISAALGIPTSFNYVVRFDPEKFSSVINNFQESNLEKRVQPYGIVSVDFLEDETLPQEKKIEKRVKTENGFEWIEKTVNHTGDELVSFEESINMTRASEQLSGSNFLLKNWLKGLTHIAEIVASDFPKDKLESQIKEIQSSVAKSFLLREFLGDCDFTSLNSGFVVNHDLYKIQYAPNFDFGECFNKLVKTKIDYLPDPSELENLQRIDPALAIKMIEKKYQQRDIPTSMLAAEFSNDEGEQNLKFVMENFPNESKEFLKNVQKALDDKTLDNIVNSYTIKNSQTPLLSEDEAAMFKDYLHARAGWLQRNLDVDKNKSKT